MESELVRRRINLIAAHFAPSDEISATHVLPMNCSGTLNSVLRRYDNKVYFARQSTSSLGFFMKQTSLEEEGDSTSFTTAPKSNVAAYESPENVRAPCFAKPARTESGLSDSLVQPMSHMQGFDHFSTLDPPSFARPGKPIARGDQLNSEHKICFSEIQGGIEWSPRMDVAESNGRYIITVEVPGVKVNDIRVEVDDKKLSVKGRRSTSWTIEGNQNVSFSSYHKREILYGPYEVAWALPSGVNKDSISAQFSDGFLQIIIPKV